MNLIAKRLLNRRMRGNQHIFGTERFRVWRDLGISWSPNVNPVELVPPQTRLDMPDNVSDFFPGITKIIDILPDRNTCSVAVTIDEMENENEKNLAVARVCLKENGSHDASDLWPWYVQAAHGFVRQGKPLPALRAFLNSRRVSVNQPSGSILYQQIGDCLLELRLFEKAAQQYVLAAEGFLSNHEEGNAADVLERAGLAWEAVQESSERPGIVATGLGRPTTYDSTVCFQMAKNYFSVVGDYDSSSRCFILERDSHKRWTPSKTRKIELWSMRTLWLYGESPVHAFCSFLVVWASFAAAFFFSGFKSGEVTINYDLSWHFELSAFSDFARSLYFSAVTMTTLGYGDYAPTSNSSMFLAGLEAFLGILLAAMFLVSVQRRYVGR